ncbi:MAG: hypothetical protein DIU80_006040 [Chloroflexota bacterium]|nr:MAG: hypothetical protein DIU80_02155 [Chloroflexota bacterium]
MLQLQRRRMTAWERRQLVRWRQQCWSPPAPCPACGSREREILDRVLDVVHPRRPAIVRWTVVVCHDCGERQAQRLEDLGVG